VVDLSTERDPNVWCLYLLFKEGSLNAYKTGSCQISFIFSGAFVCAPGRRFSSSVSRAKPSWECLDISSWCRENRGELRKRRTKDCVSLKNSLRKGLSLNSFFALVPDQPRRHRYRYIVVSYLSPNFFLMINSWHVYSLIPKEHIAVILTKTWCKFSQYTSNWHHFDCYVVLGSALTHTSALLTRWYKKIGLKKDR